MICPDITTMSRMDIELELARHLGWTIDAPDGGSIWRPVGRSDRDLLCELPNWTRVNEDALSLFRRVLSDRENAVCVAEVLYRMALGFEEVNANSNALFMAMIMLLALRERAGCQITSGDV